jgi:predicted  nucleic acid-binding Zn-ribbon protein
MEQTQTFFTNAIQEELSKLENETSEEAQAIITDALSRIENLESQYKKLQLDLEESGDDKRVIYAMISNFQNRIDLLQNVLQQIEDVKQLKNLTNENSSTL